MLDVVKMKESCRICARELCGNQRRWIFHPAAKLNLQVALSHALGGELSRDGRGEFACSKCAFMLERMFRFDTVIARVEALSLERLHRLLLEKERLRHCIGALYRKNNAGGPEGVGVEAGPEDPPVLDLAALQDVRYSDMVQDDLAYSVYESWADKEEPPLDPHQHLPQCAGPDPLTGQKPRRCRGCAALRVADSDYEAVCKVPRRVGRRSTSCGPSTRYSPAPPGAEDPAGPSEASAVTFDPPAAGMETDKTTCDRTSPSPASSAESLDTAVDREREEEEPDQVPGARGDSLWDRPPSGSALCGLEVALRLLRGWEYQPVKAQRGSRLPVLLRPRPVPPDPPRSPFCELYRPRQVVPEVVVPSPEEELQELEEQWLDQYFQCGPVHLQQRVVEEQQAQLGQCESATAQCVGELQAAQDQVHSLQAKIRASENRNQKLQERLGLMELELHSAQVEAQQQERSLHTVTDTVSSKEAEVVELYRVIEEQNQMLCSLKELVNRSQLQMSGSEGVRGPTEVLVLQASLFRAQLELQAGQRGQQRAARVQQDQNRALERLEGDLQGALQHRRDSERHNQELRLALETARSALQEREERLSEGERERRREAEENQRVVTATKTSLQTKEQLLQDYWELLEEPKEKRDDLLRTLRQRGKERDRALERALEEKFLCVEEQQEEVRRLQLLLREKERDVERQRCVLANNEETITSLEVLLRGRAEEVQQLSDVWRNAQRHLQESEERHRGVLSERDAVITQLQGALHAHTQEAQELRCSLLTRLQAAPGDVLEELKLRLQLKDRLLQEVLADRTHQAQEQQEEVQELLKALRSRDQYIQESSGRLGEVLTEQSCRLQELRRQLGAGPAAAEEELQEVQEELRLALRREKEQQEQSRSQAAWLDALSRSVHVKEEIIRDLHRQLVDPSSLPLLERLTQEVQDLKESLVQPGAGGGGPQRIMGQYL